MSTLEHFAGAESAVRPAVEQAMAESRPKTEEIAEAERRFARRVFPLGMVWEKAAERTEG